MTLYQSIRAQIREIVRAELFAGDPSQQHATTVAVNPRTAGLNFKFDQDERLQNAVDRLDDEALGIVVVALSEALELGHVRISPSHILLAIIKDGQGVAASALIGMAGTGNAARKAVVERMTGGVR